MQMSMKRSKSIDLTSGPILKTLSELALPIMASSLLGTAYNITDMAWIGLLGSKAVAGVGVGGMYLVDECHTRYIVCVSLTPYVFRLRFNTALCTEYTNSTVKYTQRTLNFYSKVNVSWSINDIDTVFQSTGFWFAVLLQCPVACCSG